MSGVNAHVLLRQTGLAAASDQQPGNPPAATATPAWRGGRHWLGPQRHSLLEAVAVASQRAVTVEFAVAMPNAAALAYLHDHQVRLIAAAVTGGA